MRRLPPLNAVRAFEAAARRGNFNQAAEELNVTPSAISHQVRSLEEFFGAKLFRRSGRKVEPDARRPTTSCVRSPRRWTRSMPPVSG